MASMGSCMMVLELSIGEVMARMKGVTIKYIVKVLNHIPCLNM